MNNRLYDILLYTFIKSVRSKDSDKINYKSVKSIVKHFSNKKNHSPLTLIVYRKITRKYMEQHKFINGYNIFKDFLFGYNIDKDKADLTIYVHGYVHMINYKNGKCSSRMENIWTNNKL